MSYKVLVTGGAGFIGSYIVDKLIKEGHEVRILDNLEPQVHETGDTPDYLNQEAEFIKGDVNNYEQFRDSLKDIDIVFHKASMVGVGQSQYQISKYVQTNMIGTANLLDILVNTDHDIKKVIVAASMSSYGEGSYECPSCGIQNPPLRTEEQMKAKQWELKCPCCSAIMKPVPTKEDKMLDSNSIYAVSKKVQEEMCIMIGKTYGIPTVSLRYFNVYGPRQSLSNPYTGVAAIFMSRIKNNNPPLIFEDGLQTRDFISVHDIADVNLLSMNSNAADYEMFNVGCGKQITISGVAETIAKLCNKDIKPEITNKYRKGDVRHCYADITKIKGKLDFSPKVSFEAGMKELIGWSDTVEADDKVDLATKELREKGLLE